MSGPFDLDRMDSGVTYVRPAADGNVEYVRVFFQRMPRPLLNDRVTGLAWLAPVGAAVLPTSVDEFPPEGFAPAGWLDVDHLRGPDGYKQAAFLADDRDAFGTQPERHLVAKRREFTIRWLDQHLFLRLWGDAPRGLMDLEYSLFVDFNDPVTGPNRFLLARVRFGQFEFDADGEGNTSEVTARSGADGFETRWFCENVRTAGERSML